MTVSGKNQELMIQFLSVDTVFLHRKQLRLLQLSYFYCNFLSQIIQTSSVMFILRLHSALEIESSTKVVSISVIRQKIAVVSVV